MGHASHVAEQSALENHNCMEAKCSPDTSDNFGKGLDLHGALSSAAPAGHEGWGGAGVRVGLLLFGAVLNPRSPSAWLVRTWVVDTVWTDDACYN